MAGMVTGKAALTLDGAVLRAKLIARRDGRSSCVVEVRAGRRLALVGRAPAPEGWVYYQAATARQAVALLARYRGFAERTGTDVASAIACVVYPNGRVEAAGELVERFEAGLIEGGAEGTL
jgi:hypothetical protein